MNNKIKVLHLITGLERGGGAENMLLNLLPKLEGQHAACVLKGHGEIAQILESKGIKIYYLDIKNPLNSLFILRYRKVLKDFKPDIQINYLIHADIFGRIFGKFFKVPKIISYIRNRHEEKIFFWLDHFTLSICDYILVNSKPLVDFYIKKHKVDKDKIEFIPNAVDIEKIEKLSKEEIDFKFNKNKKYIISTARLHPQKDIPTLIKAFDLVQKENNSVELIIAHDGPQRKEIESMVKDIGIQNKVHFIGKKNNIYPYVAKSDLFVLTSKFEGMSNAVLEAMTLKVPVVVSDIPENRQLVKNMEKGYYYNQGDEVDLFKNMKNCIGKDNNDIIINSKYLIHNHFSIHIVVNKLNEFLSKYEK